MITRYELIKIALIMTFWVIMWMLYNFGIRPMYPNPLLDDPLTTYKIKLPDCMKCYIKNVSTNPANNDCTKEDIDGWSIGHILIYFTIGAFIPNIYMEIFIISLLCEIWEHRVGWRARWIIDPITNLLGYALGVWSSSYWHFQFPIKLPDTNKTLFLTVLFLIVVMQINHPFVMEKFIGKK